MASAVGFSHARAVAERGELTAGLFPAEACGGQIKAGQGWGGGGCHGGEGLENSVGCSTEAVFQPSPIRVSHFEEWWIHKWSIFRGARDAERPWSATQRSSVREVFGVDPRGRLFG